MQILALEDLFSPCPIPKSRWEIRIDGTSLTEAQGSVVNSAPLEVGLRRTRHATLAELCNQAVDSRPRSFMANDALRRNADTVAPASRAIRACPRPLAVSELILICDGENQPPRALPFSVVARPKIVDVMEEVDFPNLVPYPFGIFFKIGISIFEMPGNRSFHLLLRLVV